MLLLEVLDDVGQVIAGGTEPLLGTRFGHAAGAIRCQVRQIPPGNETPQSRHTRMLGELAECVHGKQFTGSEPFSGARVLLIWHLTRNDLAGSRPLTPKVEKVKRVAGGASPPI